MLGVFSTTGIIFVIIALGYGSVVRGIFSKEDLRVFGRFIVTFALPALVFRAVTEAELGRVFDPGYLAAYLLGSLTAFAIGYVVSLRALGLTHLSATFQGMGMSCSNSGFVGYPILLMTLPALAPTVLALNMTVENLFMIPLVFILAEMASGRDPNRWALAGRIFARLLFRNPIVIALNAGLVVSLLGIELPRIVAQPISIVASSSTAISLMVIGGTLVGLKVRSVNARVMLVVVGKLAVFPACVLLALAALGLAGLEPASDGLVQAAILSAAVPSAGIYPIIAQRYGEEESAALAMLVMTVLSFFSISLCMAAFGLTVQG